MERRQVDLDTFLDGLPEEAAARAKAAAARIDELEHAAQRIGQSDATYLRLFAISGLLFIVAGAMLISGPEMFSKGAPQVLDIVVLLMAGALPATIVIYCVKMNERTRIDRMKFEIIESDFLPHDAIYLPPGPDRSSGVVAVTSRSGGWNRKQELATRFRKPGWYW